MKMHKRLKRRRRRNKNRPMRKKKTTRTSSSHIDSLCSFSAKPLSTLSGLALAYLPTTCGQWNTKTNLIRHPVQTNSF